MPRPAPQIALLVAAALLAALATQPLAAQPPLTQRPNVVLILADDLGFSDVGCFGGEIETPNLDRLAREGTRFTQFYDNAKCTTTRASIVTGLWPQWPHHLTAEIPTVGERLQAAGYATALIGKWHLGHGDDTHPAKRGFDRVYGLLDGCCNFFDPGRPDPKFKGGRVRWFTDQLERVTEFPDDYYTTEAFTDAAVAWVGSVAREEGPFFLHLCYTAPHYPLHARPADIAKFRGRYRELGGWLPLREERYAKQREFGLVDDAWALTDTDRNAYDWEAADQDWEDLRMATYAAMVHSMDREIGRLLATLDELGIADDTLVLFLSDNGGCAEEPGGRDTARTPGPVDDYTAVGPAWGWAQNAPFKRHKSWLHEGGITTPLIARWPGQVPAGRIERQVGHLVDLLPTFLDLAGAEPDPSLPGRSYAPVLRGATREAPERLCWFWAGNRAIREGDWKLVWDNRDKVWELYDLAKDRCETTDLAAAHPDRVAAMSARWADWLASCGREPPR